MGKEGGGENEKREMREGFIGEGRRERETRKSREK